MHSSAICWMLSTRYLIDCIVSGWQPFNLRSIDVVWADISWLSVIILILLSAVLCCIFRVCICGCVWGGRGMCLSHQCAVLVRQDRVLILLSALSLLIINYLVYSFRKYLKTFLFTKAFDSCSIYWSPFKKPRLLRLNRLWEFDDE